MIFQCYVPLMVNARFSIVGGHCLRLCNSLIIVYQHVMRAGGILLLMLFPLDKVIVT